MRFVIDPNVLVSAAVASGVSAELMDRWLTDRPFELVVCPTLLSELRHVLGRDRFRRWISAEEAERFVGRLEDEARSWNDPAEVLPVTADPKDDYLVALYRDCGADVLVSGDTDLTELEEDDVTVLTPRALLDRL